MSINPERRLMKMASECGLEVQRARKKPGQEPRYRLCEAGSGRVLAGEDFTLTLKGVARELQQRHILGGAR
jgi:hypothetical protein